MAIDTSIPRTRRALLAGGIGGLAAVVASALGRPLPADAATGSFNSAEANTPAVQGIHTATFGGPAYGVYGQTASSGGRGVRGYAYHSTGMTCGVEGLSTSIFGYGVYGHASASNFDNYGVRGEAASIRGTGVGGYAYATEGLNYGVQGQSNSTGGIGVHAIAAAKSGATVGLYGRVNSAEGTAILGHSGAVTDDKLAPVAKTGVYGYAVRDSGSRGVHGRSNAGRGVYGQATSGTGVYATATTGYALRAVGRVKLDKCAGVATIPASASSVVVTPGIDLVSTSAVVATLQGNAGAATTTVSRCYVNATTNKFTIYLTKAATQQVKVAWIVLG